MLRIRLTLFALAIAFAFGSIQSSPAQEDSSIDVLFLCKSSGFEHSSIRRKDDAPSHVERVLKKMAGDKGFNVTTSGSTITVSHAFDIVTEEDAEENWWPGGGEFASVHQGLGLLYVTMHQGEEYTHHESGPEIWVFSMAAGHRIARIEFETPVNHILVTEESEPLLIVGDDEGKTHVYDALKFTLERTIELPRVEMYVDL